MCKMCKGLVVVVAVLSGSRISDAGYSSRGNCGMGVLRVHCKSGEAVNTAAISKPDGAEEHNWPQLATIGHNWKKSRQGEPEDRS